MASVIRGSGTSSLGGNLDIEGVLTYEDVTSVDSVGIITAQSGLHVSDSIAHLGDTDTAIRFPQGNTFTIETAGTERLRVEGGGDVGIGTNNPARLLHLAGEGGATEVELRLQAMDGGERQITFTGSGSNTHTIRSTGTTDNSLVFIQGSNERLRIDSAGRILAGTTSFTGEASLVLQASNAGATTQAQLWLNRGEEDPATDNVLGQIIFGDATAAGSNGAMIQARADSSWGGANGNPTRIAFFTEDFGSDNGPTERLRITSGGALGLRSVASTSGGAPNSPHTVYRSVIDTACASGGTENLKGMANEEVSFIKVFYSWPSGSPQWKTGVISRNQGTSLTTTWFHESNSGHVFTLAMSGDTLTLTQSVGVTMNIVIAFETVDTTGLD